MVAIVRTWKEDGHGMDGRISPEEGRGKSAGVRTQALWVRVRGSGGGGTAENIKKQLKSLGSFFKTLI